ncbi:permease [Paenibacillus sp. HN-1]|uniref:permease n=1 Tax=Paenibacillus TaxID=44249 RepID=UPI001CA900E4|nr:MULTISPECIES: permease [Paenibacillus]MBY9080197.1 permease [Paenibacillus sp. CGMCC 1.18879]MBY9083144.1 permease [Paenibacillus sinensis]
MKASMLYKIPPFILPVILFVPALTVRLHGKSGLLANPQLQQIKTIFVAIILEALPFILLSVLLSSLVQVFLKDEWIGRLNPKNPLVGVLLASSLGIVLPMCECGMIPVVRRLMVKGMPAYIAVTFILSGPILNPVVLTSTLVAFRSHPEIVWSRMGLAFAVSILTGLIVYGLFPKKPLKQSLTAFRLRSGNASSHEHPQSWEGFFVHAGNELIEMSKYLALGAFVTACIQTFIPRDQLFALGNGSVSSYFFMMGFAFVLSLCSTSDAFVASAFTHTFSAGPLIAFLVLGPMLDFKSLLMLLATFKSRFVICLSVLLVILILLGSVAINFII